MSTDTLFGAFIGLILGVVGNYLFEGLGFKTRAAKLSSKRTRARLNVLAKRLQEAENYHQNPLLLLSLVAGRLLLVTVLWVAQTAGDYLLGLLNNGLYAYSRSLGPLSNLDEDLTAVTVGITSSVLSAIALLITAKLALDVYVVWRRVHRFDKFQLKIKAESAELEATSQDSVAAEQQADSTL